MKIYIAAPLFCEAERAFNERVDAIVRACGHETYLPQRDGGCVADLPETIDGIPKRKYLFDLDCRNMDACDALLFLMDGRVPDEGACFELGYCYARGKRCAAYKTDVRSFIGGFDNLMLMGAPERVLTGEEELRAYLQKLKSESARAKSNNVRVEGEEYTLFCEKKAAKKHAAMQLE